MREAGEPKVKATNSWDELGLDPELRELIDGRTYVYASTDGASFAPVEVPGAPAGGAAQVSVSDAGFPLYTSPAADGTTTSVVHSADGTTCTEAGSFPGWVQAAGELAGRPAVAISGAESTTVRVGQPDGTWTTLDLLAAVDGDSSADWIGEVDFGPLGVLATVFGESVPDHFVEIGRAHV